MAQQSNTLNIIQHVAAILIGLLLMAGAGAAWHYWHINEGLAVLIGFGGTYLMLAGLVGD